ncbi:hypothetical protein PR048_011129 [Dryococelus australis]|uniref:Uncharacterized protein n=1 Tax=Dryococelus australis TaxID=614101 RepID=A0ABQ9HM14_9NEOP|nr:hypothetical protein PR048_011129 [Dryococelus australis]
MNYVRPRLQHGVRSRSEFYAAMPNLGKLWASFKQRLNFYLQSKKLGSAVDAQKLGEKWIDVSNMLSLTNKSTYDVIEAFDQ